MKKLIVISALTTVLIVGTGFFGILSGQENREKLKALTLTQVPTNDSKAFVPWAGLKNSLERTKSVSPGNYAVPYYLGLVYLREGNRDSAIAEWENYLAVAPEDFNSVSVREQLTVLRLDQMADYAKQIVGQGSTDSLEGRLNENTLAVLNFKNLATPDFIPFIKALTMILTTDLSKVSQLVLVERLKAQAVVDEMKLGATGIADPETASKAGRFLLARNVIWGAVGSPRTDAVRITAIVGETLGPSDPVEVTSEGALDQFFDLEKQLVFGILAALGINKADLSPSALQSVEKYYTTNYKAFMFFGEGLDNLDRKDFARAKEAFKQAVDADPNFDFSSKMEKSTPRKAIPLMTFEEVARDAEQEPAGLAELVAEATLTSPASASQSSGITKEISDIAQDKLETLTQYGNIIVHW